MVRVDKFKNSESQTLHLYCKPAYVFKNNDLNHETRVRISKDARADFIGEMETFTDKINTLALLMRTQIRQSRSILAIKMRVRACA